MNSKVYLDLSISDQFENAIDKPFPEKNFEYGSRILSRAGFRQNYRSRFATSLEEISLAQALRFQVFNLELKEGLDSSFETKLDSDPFDEVCDHLLVEEVHSQTIVGTYRMQTSENAACHLGLYSAREFDLEPFEKIRSQVIELGRACVHKDHRNLAVLSMLWGGIYRYALSKSGRYLIGCSSLTSQDPKEGATMFQDLKLKHLSEVDFRTSPLPPFICSLDQVFERPFKTPKLLAAYLAIGAKICGPPAIDREFGTIDFLTFFDIKTLPENTIRRYLS